MAKHQIVVPDIGGAEGAEVVELLVAVGDEIELEQSLLVLESDKASMEIPSSAAGTVVEMLVTEGQELSEGSPILVIELAADSAGSEPAPATPETQPEPEPEHQPEHQPETATVTTESAAQNGESAPGGGSTGTVDQIIPVPDIGSDEAVELIEVSIAVGDTVAEGDSLVALESDKASMEVPAPCAGEVLEILVKEGDSVRQGDALVLMRVDSDTASDSGATADSSVGDVSPVAPAAPPPQKAPEAAPAVANVAAGTASGKQLVYAGPAVRKLAREFGVTLSEVSGTGPRNRIVKEDLHRFVQNAMSDTAATVSGGTGIPPVPEVDFSAFGPVEIVARSKMDKLTAANMQRNWLNVPHVTQFDDADITDMEAFRGSLKAEAAARGTKLTPMPFLIKACAVALRDNPKFRSSLTDGGASLATKDYVHIGMAVDTPAGLLVPVIRDVDKKTLWELAEEVLELAGKARDRKLKPVEMQGGCFTISSLGNIGGTGFTPIVNAPEVGILGVSRAEIKPVWDGETFQPRKMLPLGLSYDHRVVNGGDAGRFLTQLVGLLSDIRRLAL